MKKCALLVRKCKSETSDLDMSVSTLRETMHFMVISLRIFYRISRRSVYERWPKKKQDLSETRFILRIEYQISVRRNYSDFYQIYYYYIISERNALLAILNFSELKSLANNAKVRFLLMFLLIRYHTNNNSVNHQ